MTFLRGKSDLLKRFRNGDIQAMEEVYQAYVRDVARMVRSGVVLRSGGAIYGLRESQDCLDLVQETFARAFSESARLSYDGIRDYKNYLLTICRNLMVDTASARGREIPSSEDAFADDQPDQDLPYADEETRKAVQQYLSSLPPELAAIYGHRYQDCRTQERTAREMKISRQRVRTLEGRLRKGLSQALRRAGLKI